MDGNRIACVLNEVSVSKGRAAPVRALPGDRSLGRCWSFWVGALAVALAGCASHQGVLARSSPASGFTAPGGRRFGRIALLEESGPATFSFQTGKGKLGSAKEAIVDSAELGLSGPGAGVVVAGSMLSAPMGGDSAIEYAALAAAAGGVTAIGAALVGPAVGAEGLIRSLKTVTPAELQERETALKEAMSQMAAQQAFRAALLQAGAERMPGGFLSSEPGTAAPPEADSVLEARVDELRLERAGSSEGSFFLLIKTHVRLVRKATGAVCFQRDAEYRSGMDLFLNWTLEGAIQSVAQTGYEALAQYYVEQLLPGAGGPTNGTNPHE
jgi:hypothetical protein